MFEVGFSELLMVGLVGLLVVGPQRLPELARRFGLLLGQVRQVTAAVKAQIREELELEENRHSLMQVVSDSEAAIDEVEAAFSAFVARSESDAQVLVTQPIIPVSELNC